MYTCIGPQDRSQSDKFITDSYQFSPKSNSLPLQQCLPKHEKTYDEGENNKKYWLNKKLDSEVEENRKQFYNLYHLQVS